MGKEKFFQHVVLEQQEIGMGKKRISTPTSYYTRPPNPKWIKDLNAKAKTKTIKPLEAKRMIIFNFGINKYVLERSQQTQSIKDKN